MSQLVEKENFYPEEFDVYCLNDDIQWVTEPRENEEYRLQRRAKDVDIPHFVGNCLTRRLPLLRNMYLTRLRVKNITPLFKETDVPNRNPALPFVAFETPETYSYEKHPENNWLFSAIKGFKRLKTVLEGEQKNCSIFATVGTGSGLDALAAHFIFNPRWLYLTDINQAALDTALLNWHNNVELRKTPDSSSVWCASFMQGNLLEPLLEKNSDFAAYNRKADVIYANLPNIPADEVALNASMDSATFIDKKLVAGCPKEFDDHLLATQFHLLQQAKLCLAPGGSVIIALGGRIPYEMVANLFATCGYRLEDLYGRLKIQTQPPEVIQGYAQAEKRNGIDFTFYDLDDQFFKKYDFEFPENASFGHKQEELSPQAITAEEALVKLNQGRRIGHAVWILRGVTK